jgi:hypothetical protein
MRRMKKLVLVLCILGPSDYLLAQQATVGISGFSFVAPLKVAVGRDDGFLVDRTIPAERLFILSLPPSVQLFEPNNKPQRLSDEVLSLTLPKVAYQNYSRRHELFMTYAPDLEMFRTNSDQNSWGHDAAFSFTYHAGRNVQVSIADAYRMSKDPARTLQNVFLLLPRSLYHENDFRGEVDFQTSAVTGFQVRYDMTRSTFGQIPDPFQTERFDFNAKGLSLTMTRLVNRTQRLRTKFSIYEFDSILHTGDVDTTSGLGPIARAVEVQYRVHPNSTTYLNFTGGASQISTGLTYLFSGSADKRFGYAWFGGGFSRSLSFTALGPTLFANGLNPSGYYDAVFLTTRADLTRRSTLSFRATAVTGAANSLVLQSRSLIGMGRFDYRLSDRTVWFSSFETFQQNRNELVRSPLSRNRFMVGIEFSFSSERDRRTNRLNEDEQYVALTDHTRRRDSSE